MPVAPVFRIPVILPKLAEGLMVRFVPLPLTEPMLAPGVLYSGWFSRLKAAARKWMAIRSVKWKRFCSDESIS